MARRGPKPQSKKAKAKKVAEPPKVYEHTEEKLLLRPDVGLQPLEAKKPRSVRAVSPQRDHLEIRFPRVEGYVRAADDGSELPRYDAHRAEGSTRDVDFQTSEPVWEVQRSHLNYVVADTVRWEQSAAFYLDSDPHVVAFVKNFNLGFAIPYSFRGEMREYLPDFLVRVACDGREVGTVILEVKGYDPTAIAKIDGAHRWVAAVNAEGSHGRWDYRVITVPADVPRVLRAAVEALADPPRHDWRGALQELTRGVRELYGPRLDRVILYGSRARGDAEPLSDVDTLIVLDQCDDFWTEFDRISPIASQASLEHGVLVSAFPIGRKEFERGGTPLLMNVKREGKLVS